ncbi:MAG TPA: hypothetical protein VD947_02080 [Patescibacteria group bacterium]|nr:hypothetical protein [Patescibacteria group bacterium]
MSRTREKIKRSVAIRILWVLLSVTFIITATHLLFQYLNLAVFYQQVGQFYELSNRFDFDDESSVPTWFSQLLFLAIGVSALFAAYLQKDKAPRRLWSIIAGIGLVFSLDEISGLHERVLQSIHVLLFQDAGPTKLANAWWVVLPFVLIICGWLIWQIARLLPTRTLFIFVLSGFVFLSGAVLIDLFTSVASRETFLNQGVYVAIEETLELIGTIIALYAILDYLETNYHTTIANAIRQLKPKR